MSTFLSLNVVANSPVRDQPNYMLLRGNLKLMMGEDEKNTGRFPEQVIAEEIDW